MIAGAKPTVTSVQGNLAASLTPATKTFLTLATTAPVAGTMVVTAAGYVFQETATPAIARCNITTGSGIEFAYLMWMKMDSGAESSDQFAGTRTYSVDAGENFSVNLACNEEGGGVAIADANMVAVFIPG